MGIRERVKKVVLRRLGVTVEVLDAAAKYTVLQEWCKDINGLPPKETLEWMQREWGKAVGDLYLLREERGLHFEVSDTVVSPVHPRLTARALQAIFVERASQDEKWGEQNHPFVSKHARDPIGGGAWSIGCLSASMAKEKVEEGAKDGTLTYGAIVYEEFCEAVEAAAEGDRGALEIELVQTAATIVGALESLWRNEDKLPDGRPVAPVDASLAGEDFPPEPPVPRFHELEPVPLVDGAVLDEYVDFAAEEEAAEEVASVEGW